MTRAGTWSALQPQNGQEWSSGNTKKRLGEVGWFKLNEGKFGGILYSMWGINWRMQRRWSQMFRGAWGEEERQ